MLRVQLGQAIEPFEGQVGQVFGRLRAGQVVFQMIEIAVPVRLRLVELAHEFKGQGDVLLQPGFLTDAVAVDELALTLGIALKKLHGRAKEPQAPFEVLGHAGAGAEHVEQGQPPGADLLLGVGADRHAHQRLEQGLGFLPAAAVDQLLAMNQSGLKMGQPQETGSGAAIRRAFSGAAA